MSRSYTYHVVGCAPVNDHTDRLFCAMSRVEMVQQMRKAEREGLHISRWEAQTKTGIRMLALPEERTTARCYTVEIEHILPKLVECPICGGKGCPVCDYSGVCKKDHEKLWREWQLAEMRKEYGAS
jgi:hypothetical protein